MRKKCVTRRPKQQIRPKIPHKTKQKTVSNTTFNYDTYIYIKKKWKRKTHREGDRSGKTLRAQVVGGVFRTRARINMCRRRAPNSNSHKRNRVAKKQNAQLRQSPRRSTTKRVRFAASVLFIYLRYIFEFFRVFFFFSTAPRLPSPFGSSANFEFSIGLRIVCCPLVRLLAVVAIEVGLCRSRIPAEQRRTSYAVGGRPSTDMRSRFARRQPVRSRVRRAERIRVFSPEFQTTIRRMRTNPPVPTINRAYVCTYLYTVHLRTYNNSNDSNN